MTITADSITANESVPARSRTYSPEVVAKVSELLRGIPADPGDPNSDPPREATEAVEPVRNVSVGVFDKEGAARSALVTLNKLLTTHDPAAHPSAYAGTVRETEDGKYKAILLNKTAKKVERKANATAKKNGKK